MLNQYVTECTITQLLPNVIVYEIITFLPVESIQEIEKIDYSCKYFIKYSNILFKMLCKRTIFNHNGEMTHIIHNCKLFSKSISFQVMMRIISFNPMIIFKKYSIPLICLNNMTFRAELMNFYEKQLFKVQYIDVNENDTYNCLESTVENINYYVPPTKKRRLNVKISSQNVYIDYKDFKLNKSKWEFNIKNFIRNLELYFFYDKWRILLKRCILAGGAVLACLKKNTNALFCKKRDLDFWIINSVPNFSFWCYVNMIYKKWSRYAIIKEYDSYNNHIQHRNVKYIMDDMVSFYINFSTTRENLPSFKKYYETIHMLRIENNYEQDWTSRHEEAYQEYANSVHSEFGWIKIQIMYIEQMQKKYQILSSFDIDLCQVAFDGSNINATWAAYRAMQTNTILNYRIINNPFGIEILKRIRKYTRNYHMNWIVPTEFKINDLFIINDLEEHQKKYNEWIDNNICVCSWMNLHQEYCD